VVVLVGVCVDEGVIVGGLVDVGVGGAGARELHAVMVINRTPNSKRLSLFLNTVSLFQ
jgi:hypothetical protein